MTALATSATAYAAQAGETKELTDTVINIDNPSNIILSETPDGITLTINENSDSVTTYTYKHPDPGNVDISSTKTPALDNSQSIVLSSWQCKSKLSLDIVTGGLAFGKNFAFGQPSPMDITTGRSWEISWMYILGLKIQRGRNAFTTGIGLNWRNYCLTGPYQFVKTDNSIDLDTYPEGTEGKQSRLKIVTLSIPLLYRRQIWKSISITAGGILNFATHSSIENRFHSNGREIKTSHNGIYPRPVTVDAYGALTVWGISWYVRYSPMKVIRDKRGPDFTALSTGLVLFM